MVIFDCICTYAYAQPEINYMDLLEFAEEPRNCTLSFDMNHTVQYADLRS